MRPLLFGIAVILLDYILYRAFAYLGIAELRIIRYSIDGIGIAVLVTVWDRAQQRRARQRAEQLGYLNHHVRNAVQIMLGIHLVHDEAARKQLIRESAARIIRTLNNLTEGSFQKEELKDLQNHEAHTGEERKPPGSQVDKPGQTRRPDSKTA